MSSDAEPGIYPISLSPTILNSTAMGFDGAGEAVPPLVSLIEGESDLTQAYPELPASFVNGAVTVAPSRIDTDGDGIDDRWEEDYFPGNLSILGAGTDYDNDGYSDLQEYLNSLEGLDDYNMAWDPTKPNEPGQNGYEKPGKKNFWILVLPAIQAGAQQAQ